METKVVMVKQMPVDLWRKIKVQAAIENTTIQATVAKAITQYLEKSA